SSRSSGQRGSCGPGEVPAGVSPEAAIPEEPRAAAPDGGAWRRPPGIHPIRGLMAVCQLLVEGDEAVLLDTGMIGEPLLLRRRVRRLGLRPDSIKAILLTHGHLDHA